MSKTLSTDELLSVIHGALLSEVRREDADLTMRQIAILLMVYLTDEPQTVRGLAAHLRISKPAVTRGMDRLVLFELIRREEEPEDRRSVIAVRTAAGAEMMERLKAALKATRSDAG
ncbi:winged helix-turn-helix transcriptional regulator [Belnapia sp. T6]|uniref:Winged helix-turn-helix transcriptional regulator n=1 Tax=Belnapia mucosa TaxID=2804532 RepID=A0ABS1VBC9_9PROT|nr:MarR family winged helix-turn-helix transcriptional regulator [Belnapia mucosa]MBL6458987.1 winged helix-turn-helix transcriptional regulator [Belnapia mucosa]